MSDQHIRQRLEEREEQLSPYATKSRLSKGRVRPEEPCSMRTAFQRDRDRIIHSKAFRRLKHKTQVFIAPLGDHYVTRLTHTLEVSQIARSIARALNLNEDLAEAISLGHDLGHAPFGHIGEDVLSELYPGGFKHSVQSLRVVDHLEKDGKGLNLTWEVRQGIVTHSKSRNDILGEGWNTSKTLEAQVCKIADAMAYLNHDIDDAIRAGLIKEEDLPFSVREVLGHSTARRINSVIRDIVENSWAATGEMPLAEGDEPSIGMSPQMVEATNILRKFLFERAYEVSGRSEMAERARDALRRLYEYFSQHPEKIPQEYNIRGEDPQRQTVDYISGMTDNYALRLAEEISPVYS